MFVLGDKKVIQPPKYQDSQVGNQKTNPNTKQLLRNV